MPYGRRDVAESGSDSRDGHGVEDLAGVEAEETATEELVSSKPTGSGQAQECMLVPGPDAIVPGMADDKTKTGPQDAQRVNVHED
jgi:hypothetical protein